MALCRAGPPPDKPSPLPIAGTDVRPNQGVRTACKWRPMMLLLMGNLGFTAALTTAEECPLLTRLCKAPKLGSARCCCCAQRCQSGGGATIIAPKLALGRTRPATGMLVLLVLATISRTGLRHTELAYAVTGAV